MDRAQHRLIMLEREKQALEQQVCQLLSSSVLLSIVQKLIQCTEKRRSILRKWRSQSLYTQVGKHTKGDARAEAITRHNDSHLKAELSSQRELVSRLHAELATGVLVLNHFEAICHETWSLGEVSLKQFQFDKGCISRVWRESMICSAVSSRADEESNAWNAKCEGLRQALQAQELHAENLEKELAMRPSSRQVMEYFNKMTVHPEADEKSAHGHSQLKGTPAFPVCDFKMWSLGKPYRSCVPQLFVQWKNPWDPLSFSIWHQVFLSANLVWSKGQLLPNTTESKISDARSKLKWYWRR